MRSLRNGSVRRCPNCRHSDAVELDPAGRPELAGLSTFCGRRTVGWSTSFSSTMCLAESRSDLGRDQADAGALLRCDRAGHAFSRPLLVAARSLCSVAAAGIVSRCLCRADAQHAVPRPALHDLLRSVFAGPADSRRRGRAARHDAQSGGLRDRDHPGRCRVDPQIATGSGIVARPVPRRQVFQYIIFMPAVARVWPALSSQFVLMLLASSICSFISVEELSGAAAIIEQRTFRSFETYIIVDARSTSHWR